MTTTHDGRRLLKGAGITLLALVGGLAGGIWWFFATFTFAVEGPTHAMHVDAALGLVAAAGLVLVLGLSLGRAVRAPAWSLVPVALVSVALVAAAACQLSA